MRSRDGFTLAEVVVALVIAGIVGVAMTRVLTSQNQFFDQQTNQRAARDVATNAMNIMLNDLRMVQDMGGVDAVGADGKSIRVFVPYRFGLVCGTSGSVTTVSMLPTDSATSAMATYGGFAWRSPTTGLYTYVLPNGAPVSSASPSLCTGTGGGQASLTSVSVNGRTGDILDLKSPSATGAPVTAPVFMWQKVTYSFAASTTYPGMIALWRNLTANGVTTNEELLAPFDTSARFRFYLDGNDVSQVAVPSDLTTIRGLDIVLNALSPRASSINNATSVTKLTTAVFFKNVRTF
jgi:prepilin-type N-terminal cleavage/methylation domain-containing protein